MIQLILFLILILLYLVTSKYDYNVIKERDFWTSLSPRLHIYDNEFVQGTKLVDWKDDNITMIRSLMKEEGYVKLDPLFNDTFDDMKLLINKLDELELPIPFAFMFDEFWLLFMRLHNIIGSVLGQDYYRLPDFWAWSIDSKTEQSGWSIHRDKSYETAIFNESGLPRSITIWIPLSNVDCLNSCIYILPANRDPTYGSKEDIRQSKYWPDIIPNVRALPGNAGSILIWNQAVWHWGSKSSSRVTEPRISVSIEYQSRNSNLLNIPVANPLLFPTYDDRIALIAKQILQYQHMYPLDDEVKKLASEIVSKQGLNRSEL